MKKASFKKIIPIALLSIIATSTSAQESDKIANVYKLFIVNEIDYFNSDIFNELIDIKKLKDKKDLRGLADIVDYCYDLSDIESKYCYITLSKAGNYESFYGLAEKEFNLFIKEQDVQVKAQKLINSAILYGMGDGFKSIKLNYETPYRSHRKTYNDFKESEFITPENKEVLHSFYLKGITESIDIPLNKMFFEPSDNFYSMTNLGIEIEIDDDLKGKIDNGEYGDILMPIRENLKSPTSLNFLMKSIANERFEDVFHALVTGEYEFPKNKNIGLYGLYDLAIKKGNVKAIENLSLELYRDYKLNKYSEEITEDEINEIQNTKLENIIKLLALAKTKGSKNENILKLLLSEPQTDEKRFIKIHELFNKYRKEAIFY